MEKQVRVFVIFILIVIFFCGCRTYSPSYEYSDTRNIMRKQDVYINTGQCTAYYDGRIYYISQEDGYDGIYSMDENGGDIRFELSTPKITRLIVLEDSIYYVGVKEVYNGETLFGLYSFNRANSTVEEVQYTQYPDSVDDAYIATDGTVCVMEDYGVKTSNSPKDYLYLCGSQSFISSNISNDCIIQLNSQLVFSGNNLYMDAENLIGDESCALLDAITGNILMDNTELYKAPYFKALYAQDDKLWFALDNELLEIDRETLKINFVYRFDNAVDNMKLTQMYKTEDIAYVLFEKRGSDIQLLYALQLEQAWSMEIGSFNNNKVLLHISNGSICWAENDMIYCNIINEAGIGSSIFDIEMPKSIIKGNLLEIAGNWLFIYKSAQAAGVQTNQLLYKVNLSTQNIIAVGD